MKDTELIDYLVSKEHEVIVCRNYIRVKEKEFASDDIAEIIKDTRREFSIYEGIMVFERG